jgi:hypothetical protein
MYMHIRNQVCPLLLQTLKGRVDFPLLVRLLRTVGTVAVELGDCLLPQCEVTQLLWIYSCD